MTVAVKSRKPIIVPPTVLRRAGFKSGDELELKVSKGTITILPKPPADEEYSPAQRRLINARLEKADADVKAGRTRGPFTTHKEFMTTLHGGTEKPANRKTKRSPG